MQVSPSLIELWDEIFTVAGEYQRGSYRRPRRRLRMLVERLLGMALMMADVEGIIGNTLLAGRRTTFAPRRKLLVLE